MSHARIDDFDEKELKLSSDSGVSGAKNANESVGLARVSF